MKTIIEPFRVKSVEPIRLTTEAQRRELIAAASYNLFALRSEDVIIDLLTDSGTSAMSTAQWSALMMGDESYAGSPSYFRFEAAVKELMPFRHVIPTHQGRAAEAILTSLTCSAGNIVPNNTHFDTTRANVEARGAVALDLVTGQADDSASEYAFKGNMDTSKLEALLSREGERVPLVMLTVTNNAGGGQPVSMANIRATREICTAHGRPLFIDGCRFAENAYFIKLREPGYGETPVPEIVREMFSYADGMTMSAKKDAFANIGGWLALNDDDWAARARSRLVVTEGFPTYGGLSGRDLECVAAGLAEIVDENYLRYRVRSIEYVNERLHDMGIPVVRPAGGHAVFIEAGSLLPHIPALQFPGQALAIALYEAGGIRAAEIGSLMFGRQSDGTETPARRELVRLAMPRRVYTQSQADYVLECCELVRQRAAELPGLCIVWEPPALRHFTARLAPLEPS